MDIRTKGRIKVLQAIANAKKKPTETRTPINTKVPSQISKRDYEQWYNNKLLNTRK